MERGTAAILIVFYLYWKTERRIRVVTCFRVEQQLDTEIFKPHIKVCEIQNFFNDHCRGMVALRSTVSNGSGKTHAASKHAELARERRGLLSNGDNLALPVQEVMAMGSASELMALR